MGFLFRIPVPVQAMAWSSRSIAYPVVSVGDSATAVSWTGDGKVLWVNESGTTTGNYPYTTDGLTFATFTPTAAAGAVTILTNAQQESVLAHGSMASDYRQSAYQASIYFDWTNPGTSVSVYDSSLTVVSTFTKAAGETVKYVSFDGKVVLTGVSQGTWHIHEWNGIGTPTYTANATRTGSFNVNSDWYLSGDGSEMAEQDYNGRITIRSTLAADIGTVKSEIVNWTAGIAGGFTGLNYMFAAPNLSWFVAQYTDSGYADKTAIMTRNLSGGFDVAVLASAIPVSGDTARGTFDSQFFVAYDSWNTGQTRVYSMPTGSLVYTLPAQASWPSGFDMYMINNNKFIVPDTASPFNSAFVVEYV